MQVAMEPMASGCRWGGQGVAPDRQDLRRDPLVRLFEPRHALGHSGCPRCQGHATHRVRRGVAGCGLMERLEERGQPQRFVGVWGQAVGADTREQTRDAPRPRVSRTWLPGVDRFGHPDGQAACQQRQPPLFSLHEPDGDLSSRQSDEQVRAQLQHRIVPTAGEVLQSSSGVLRELLADQGRDKRGVDVHFGGGDAGHQIFEYCDSKSRVSTS